MTDTKRTRKITPEEPFDAGKIELTPEFEKIIKDVAQFIEGWEYDGNRVDLKPMIDGLPGLLSPGNIWPIRIKDSQALIISVFYRSGAYASLQAGNYQTSLDLYQSTMKEFLTLPFFEPPPNFHFCKPGVLKSLFDNILSENKLLLFINPDSDVRPMQTIDMLWACHLFYALIAKAGDPLVGDFEGALLIKKFRPDGPYDDEALRAWDKAEKHLADAGCKDKDPLEWLIKKYGKEKGEKFYWSSQAYGQVGKSWECRDCAVLDSDEYFEKRYSQT